MSAFQLIMSCIVLGVAWVSRHNWRGLLCIGALITDYLVSSMWWDIGGSNPELVAGLCDAAVCLLLVLVGRNLWECWVCMTFLTMLSINFLYLAQNLSGLHVVGHNEYSTALELLNVLALALIGGVSAYEMSGKTDGWAWNPWRFALRARGALMAAVDRNPPPRG